MKPTTQRFTVVIPVYNGAATIGNALRSCLEQTVLPDAIIVIDDGSTDGTIAIVESFGSPLVQVLRNPRNSGPSFSRNAGLRMVNEGWVLFLDADDVFHPEKTAIIARCIAAYPSVRAIGHAFDIKGSGRLPIEREALAPRRLSVASVLMRNPVVTPALCVHAGNGLFFNEQMRYAEDHDFIVRTTERYGLHYIDIALCSLGHVPLTGKGLSGNRWNMRKGEMHMYIDYCRRHRNYLLLPFLLLFSLMKHIKQVLFPIKNTAR